MEIVKLLISEFRKTNTRFELISENIKDSILVISETNILIKKGKFANFVLLANAVQKFSIEHIEKDLCKFSITFLTGEDEKENYTYHVGCFELKKINKAKDWLQEIKRTLHEFKDVEFNEHISSFRKKVTKMLSRDRVISFIHRKLLQKEVDKVLKRYKTEPEFQKIVKKIEEEIFDSKELNEIKNHILNKIDNYHPTVEQKKNEAPFIIFSEISNNKHGLSVLFFDKKNILRSPLKLRTSAGQPISTFAPVEIPKQFLSNMGESISLEFELDSLEPITHIKLKGGSPVIRSSISLEIFYENYPSDTFRGKDILYGGSWNISKEKGTAIIGIYLILL